MICQNRMFQTKLILVSFNANMELMNYFHSDIEITHYHDMIAN